MQRRGASARHVSQGDVALFVRPTPSVGSTEVQCVANEAPGACLQRTGLNESCLSHVMIGCRGVNCIFDDSKKMCRQLQQPEFAGTFPAITS